MPRRGRAVLRVTPPDPKYGSPALQKFINKVMLNGKKARAERIVYGALESVSARAKREPMEVFDQAMRNATPVLQVKPRRVGGATYQVPMEIRPARRIALAMRWLIHSARVRSGHSMVEKLSAELLDAAQGQGATIKRKEDTHRMAEANKAFVHYRW